MTNSILVAWNDSVSSRAALNYFIGLSICPEDCHITLLHVYRNASASEEVMGKTFTKKEKSKLAGLMQNARDKLVENGFDPKNIDIELVAESYLTIADGIIEQFNKRDFDMVLIGRKRMSKAEEFVMGDISVKLVRALEKAAILVVKSP